MCSLTAMREACGASQVALEASRAECFRLCTKRPQDGHHDHGGGHAVSIIISIYNDLIPSLYGCQDDGNRFLHAV